MSPTGYPDYPTSLALAPRFTVFKPPSPTNHENGWFDEVEGHTLSMRAPHVKAMTVLAVLMCSSLAGCLGGGDLGNEKNPISMNVHYDATSGTITERIQLGDSPFSAQTGVELSFDFARVTSNAGTMKSFTLDPGDDEDGANAVTVNANEQAELTYTYETHGLFTVVLSAVDESDNEASVSLTVRIDKEIDWTQTNTDEPDSMVLSTTPDCTCPPPERIVIDSTIENPSVLPTGTPITATWHLDNPQGQEQAFHTEQIGDGQEASWIHTQYNIDEGDWALNVTIDSGNDSINLHHIVLITYEANESEPNPVTSEATEKEEDSLSV